MKFRHLIISFSLIIITLQPLHADVITLRTDTWCPYSCEPGSKNPGYMIEILQTIFKAAGHQVDYKTIPWARAVKLTREGKFSGIVAAYKEDAPDFLFTDDFGTSTTAFFGKKGIKWRYKDIESLKSVKIGVIKDYAYTDELDKYIAENLNSKNVQVVAGENGLALNIKKIIKNRIDVLLENKMVFASHIKNNSYSSDQFETYGDLSVNKVYTAFSPKNKKSKEYVKIVNDGMKKLKSSGEFGKILKKYGL